ncbi:related to Asparagine-rich protein [Zygosaccharomyces bailii]|nr:related to Asparagine-rich protein [Zygosaccharomyces bailii]
MYYVVLEVETTHLIETPKDQCKIAKISYQFVNADTLQTTYDDDQVPIITLSEAGSPSLQEAVTKLDQDIAKVTGDDPFVLCSLNSTWHVRVTLPRQARDHGFMLPPHLQHPKIFDLWKEYERWCVNHPEVMPLRKNGGAGGKRIKDLAELARVLDLPKPNLADSFDLPRSVEVLLQLHKKCTTQEDMSMVLTRPYDSHTDTRDFLQEYSKVLYLNNLPPDTTQSELESWFTQFGARPVGFWTVKNIVEETSNVNNNWSMNNSPYVEEQDSISGFVVFQTHEEAAEVLILNGRSILSNMANTKQPRVVEHIVEIQPSSTRVLDRAQEILSPFPQSKNKPRPGDWNCPSCGFSNFQRRTACFRCSFPAATAVQVNTKQYINSTGPNLQGGKITPSPSQSYYPLNVSQSQGMLAAHGRGMDQGMVMMRYQNGGNGLNFSQNGATNGGGGGNRYNGSHGGNMGNGGSNVPFRAGDWKCPACTYHNFAKNVVCLRCGGPKVTAVDLENVSGSSAGAPVAKNGSVSLLDLASMGSTLSLGDKLSSNHATAAHDGFGVSLDSRSVSEPKW